MPNPQPGRFYILPKVHKEGTPGRPIVSSNGCATERVSQFVDFHINGLVSTLPSFVQDDMDFLRHVEDINQSGPLPEGSLLCTLDVSSLYTNIPHSEGLAATKQTVDRHLPQMKKDSPSSSFIVELIQIILTMNCFIFSDVLWEQCHGTAMGTCMAPSYANLFMGMLEERLLSAATHSPRVWLRYIDDIFMIWTSGRDTLESFLTFINSFHPTIKFTNNISPVKLPFLDVMITIVDGFLHTDLYSKPTDTFNYLHWTSCHPSHTKRSIPYSLAFRLVRICSDTDSLQKRLDDLSQHLMSRGFPKSQIDAAIKKATAISRPQALQRKKTAQNSHSNRIPFVLTFNPRLPEISTILKTYFPILQSSEKCKKAIPHVPFVSYRKPPNLRNLLVRARMRSTTPQHKGFEPCLSSRCKTCGSSVATSSFTSHHNNKHFFILHHITCSSTKLIYLITCTLCGKQYVGQTEQTLRQRMNGHRHCILNDRDTPVSRHFNLPDHSFIHLQVIGIDHVPGTDTHGRMNKETFWIHALGTLEPNGINVQEQHSFPISLRPPSSQ